MEHIFVLSCILLIDFSLCWEMFEDLFVLLLKLVRGRETIFLFSDSSLISLYSNCCGTARVSWLSNLFSWITFFFRLRAAPTHTEFMHNASEASRSIEETWYDEILLHCCASIFGLDFLFSIDRTFSTWIWLNQIKVIAVRLDTCRDLLCLGIWRAWVLECKPQQ